eukprot:s231_g6.t1
MSPWIAWIAFTARWAVAERLYELSHEVHRGSSVGPRWTPGSFLRKNQIETAGENAWDPSDEDLLDGLWEQDFNDGEGIDDDDDDDDDDYDDDDDEKSEMFDDDETLAMHHEHFALHAEKHYCDVDGVLRLHGTINVGEKRQYINCSKVVAQEALFNLSAPLQFSDSLELEGNLTVVAVKKGFTCITVLGNLRISGNITFRGCQGGSLGGATNSRNFTMESGDLKIQHCSAEKEGGAIYAYHVQVHGGSMEITNCQAGSSGGGIYAERSLLMLGGRLRVDGCSALGGGALFAHHLRQSGGELSLQSCVARVLGGGFVIPGEYSLSDGDFVARNCSAGHEGGGVWSNNITQAGGNFAVEKCQAGESGGGVLTRRFHQLKGRLTVENCSARHGGGVMMMIDFVQFPSGTATFRTCRAGLGGCIFSSGNLRMSGSLDFESATAEYGGGMFVDGNVDAARSQVSFSNCHSTASGASLWASGAARLGKVSVIKCSPGMLSAVLVAKDLIAKQVTIGGDSKSSIELSAVAGGYAQVESMVCYNTDHCDLRAAEEIRLGDLRCPLGSGRENSSSGSGCRRCPASEMSLLDTINASCQKCPDEAEVCLPDRLKMPAGTTVDPQNLSTALHCANPSACPGGELTRLHMPENVTGKGSQRMHLEDQVSRAMCRDGYAGKTCEQCAGMHGMADSSPLQCTPCPKTSFFSLTQSIAFYVTKDAFLFLSATSSALTAGQQKKQSAVMINQLMAFATVSNIVIGGLMQSESYKHLQEDTQRLMRSADVVVDIAQGQGGGGISRECVLKSLNLPSSLGHCHLASIIMPILLMASLAFKEPRLSVVVGTNVFLPAFTAAFGKYLIAFRTKPQSQGGTLETPFLPGFAFDWLVISGTILLCFTSGILGWARAVLSHPGEGTTAPKYVLYLTQSYKSECCAWEIERLVRKMLLCLITTLLPVTYSPSWQMESVSLILIASLLLHFIFKPYNVDLWNATEIGLLTIALVLTGLTTTVLANDLHWAHSFVTGRVMIVVVIMLVAVICGTMAFLVIVNIVKERRWKPDETTTISEPKATSAED